jgi:hypothetical protein
MGHTTIDTLDQADEDKLNPTASDEALEAAAGTAVSPPSYVCTLWPADCWR